MAYSNGYRRSQRIFTFNACRMKSLNRNLTVPRGGIAL